MIRGKYFHNKHDRLPLFKTGGNTIFLFFLFQPFFWLLQKNYRIHFPKKGGFLYRARLINRKLKLAWRTKLIPSPFCHYFDVHCCFKPVWCDSKKTPASLINIHGSFMIKCQIKHSLKLRNITENIGHYVPWTSILFIKDSCF